MLVKFLFYIKAYRGISWEVSAVLFEFWPRLSMSCRFTVARFPRLFTPGFCVHVVFASVKAGQESVSASRPIIQNTES